MSITRPSLIVAFLGVASVLPAEEVTTATTPVEQAADAASTLSDAPDPVAEVPLSTDLPAEPAPAAPAAPTTNVTINLINLLVQKGTLSRAEAAEMIQQAEADAVTAQNAAARAEIAALPPAPSEDEMRVTYIPEVVKNNMRDQIKQELMAASREEKWSEKQYPEWTSKFRPFGDIRARFQGDYFPDGNDNTGAFPNFNAINTGSPYDVSTSNPQFAPQRNVDEDRERIRLRARLGTDIMLGDGFNAGFRVATGDSNSPTSTNQTLGSSGGNFSKYAIWLDRAFLSYDAGPGDGQELTFLVGRFDNPFFSTDIHWDNDLGFDGLALRGKVRISDCASTFFTAGYFPVYNTDFNVASNQPSKFDSTDKWLTGGQLGIDWKFADDWKTKFSVAYYAFDGVQGKLSSPYTPLSTSDAGDTDTTRPSFAQNGNTYIPLRNITPTTANDFGNLYQFQYFGLASEFENLTVTGKLTYEGFDPVALSLVGEATKNLAFEVDPATAIGNRGDNNIYEGGDTAWYSALQVGKPALATFGDWQASIGYRYVESDAVVDAFTESDFGGGGTNVQGFTIGGDFALSPFVRLGVSWMSSNEIAGPPLSYDTLQFDINAKF